MNTILRTKNKVARGYGYEDWESFYSWIARDGERPDVVAQQIESAMEDVLKDVVVNSFSLARDHSNTTLETLLEAL